MAWHTKGMKPTNVPRRTLLARLRAHGFIIDEGRGKGSHVLAYHPDNPSRRAIIPVRDPVAPGTLRNILKSVDLTLSDLDR